MKPLANTQCKMGYLWASDNLFLSNRNTHTTINNHIRILNVFAAPQPIKLAKVTVNQR